ncbi:hypothetical protein BX265_8496 [Streptomyces sp. TLI_235]|nr:hypothetical protein [Streptomyces sp. TLI_235]PBC66171.1 hypothetical protein BX265_8496 [Streptomyces sp. TLI_235]
MEEGFDAVADRLYTLPPGGFTAARTQAAAEARKTGDKALAARITALHRPTRSAWAVNLLVRSRPDEARALLDLGRSLRRAQRELAGPALRGLTAERRRLVAALTAQVREAAAEAGEQLGEAPLREVEQTLRAALAGEDAAELFAAGRLTAALEESGSLPADGLPAGWGLPTEPAESPTEPAEPAAPAASAAPRGRARTGTETAGTRAAAQEVRRQRAEAERALAEAEQEERSAAREHRRLTRTVERLATAERKAADRAERARAAVLAAEEQLTAAEAERSAAGRARGEAEQDATAGADRAALACDRAERARARLADLPAAERLPGAPGEDRPSEAGRR